MAYIIMAYIQQDYPMPMRISVHMSIHTSVSHVSRDFQTQLWPIELWPT